MIGYLLCGKSGYLASIAGDEVFPVPDLGALPGGVIWVSSLDSLGLSRAGIEEGGAIKPSNFFHVEAPCVLREMGFLADGAATRTLSETYNRVVYVAARKLGVSRDAIEAACLGAASFADALLEFHAYKTDVRVEFEEGCLESFSGVRKRKKHRSLNGRFALVLPRADFSYEVMRTPLPVGRFMEMSLSDSRGRNFDWLKYGAPVFCQVSLCGAETPVAAALDHGVKSGARFWVGQPELVLLLSMGTVDIHRVFMADKHAAADAALTRSVPSPTPIESMGMSSSIFYECLMHGLATSLPGVNEESGAQYVRSAWYSSAIRAASMVGAMGAVVGGLDLVGFEGPTIHVNGDASKVAAVAEKLGAVWHQN